MCRWQVCWCSCASSTQCWIAPCVPCATPMPTSSYTGVTVPCRLRAALLRATRGMTGNAMPSHTCSTFLGPSAWPWCTATWHGSPIATAASRTRAPSSRTTGPVARRRPRGERTRPPSQGSHTHGPHMSDPWAWRLTWSSRNATETGSRNAEVRYSPVCVSACEGAQPGNKRKASAARMHTNKRDTSPYSVTCSLMFLIS
mmetsp:Transcript_18264/g.49141  ORF Transcript_18264/g.49141 Transcript_18264/m.49141 type:complete len:200 (-) Transcript_18264:54-653(-)